MKMHGICHREVLDDEHGALPGRMEANASIKGANFKQGQLSAVIQPVELLHYKITAYISVWNMLWKQSEGTAVAFGTCYGYRVQALP